MTEISICDVCKTRYDKLTRATKHMCVKGHNNLRIDLCNVHTFEFHKKFPKVTAEYVQYIYEMVYGTKLSLESAQDVLRGRR